MGIYYYAIDHGQKKYFSAPNSFGIKYPSIFHPDNPFPHMLVMQNCKGGHFVIENDCQHDIPPSDEYVDVEVYKEYLDMFRREMNENDINGYDKKADDEMGSYYTSRIELTEMKCKEHQGKHT